MVSKPTSFLSSCICNMEVCTGKSRKAYFNNTHSKVQTDKKNRKGETLKKPEITEDLTNLCEAWIGHTKVSYPCRKAAKWRKKIVLFLLRLAALNNFILFKKYTTN
jgi:hypothetical protein